MAWTQIGGGGMDVIILPPLEADFWTAKAAMPTARSNLAAAAPGNGKLYAVGGEYGSSHFATNEEYNLDTIVLPVKAGDIVYYVGGSLRVGSQNIPMFTKTTVNADGDLVLSGQLVHGWVQRP